MVGCNPFVVGDEARHRVSCYDAGSSSYVSMGEYTTSAAYIDDTFTIAAACLTNANEANSVRIKVTFDPTGTDGCGSMDVDYADVSII
mgnify:FL=1